MVRADPAGATVHGTKSHCDESSTGPTEAPIMIQ
jgi:hypothetical protein